MIPPFIPVLSVVKPLQKVFASYQRMAAIFWFLLAFAIYMSVIYMSSHFAAAGYVNQAAVPFIKEFARNISYTQDIDIEDTYDTDRLKNIVKFLEEKVKETKAIINDKSSTLESIDESRKWLENNEKIVNTLKRRLFLLEKHDLTFTEKEELRPRQGDQTASYLLAKVERDIEKYFNSKSVSEFAVVRKEGFIQGGVVINHVFVSHWLWYAPMIIAIFYFLIDILRPTPLPIPEEEKDEEESDVSILDKNKS